MSAVDIAARAMASRAVATGGKLASPAGASSVGMASGGTVENAITVISAPMLGALAYPADATDAFEALARTGWPRKVPSNWYQTSKTLWLLNGKPFSGEGACSIVRAAPDFEQTVSLAYDVTDGGTATIPAPVVLWRSSTARADRGSLYSFAIDGALVARSGLYVGFCSHIPVDQIQIYDCVGAGLIYDGVQNRGGNDITVTNCSAGVRLLNGTYNCNFTRLDVSEAERWMEAGSDSSYPNYGVFTLSSGDYPRNFTVRDFIWERLTGRPVVPVSLTGAHQVLFENGEMVANGGTADVSGMMALNRLTNCYRVTYRNLTIQGSGALTFPAGMSIFHVDGSIGDCMRWEGLEFIGWNATSDVPNIRSVWRIETNGDFVIDQPRLTSVGYQKLIEATAPSRVTYVPARRSGTWAQRPRDWIEARCEYTVVDSAMGFAPLPLVKSTVLPRSETLQGAASTGSDTLAVNANFTNAAIPGDQVCITLADGSFHVSTITSVAPGASIMISAPLPGGVQAGASVQIGGRWYQPNGLHYFGPQSYAAGETMPKVAGVTRLVLSGSAQIVNLLYGQVGQRVTLECGSGTPSIVNGAKIRTSDGANVALSASAPPVQFELGSDFVWRQIG